jgi:hypothetical protein
MADVVSIAQERRKALLAELAELDAFLRQAESLAQRYGGGMAPTTHQESPSHQSRRPSPITSATYEVARRVLRDRGHPVRLGDLLGAMREAGVEVGGRDPGATLSARLSNSSEFKSHRGKGWWFADEPLPPEGLPILEAGDNPAKENNPASNDSHKEETDASSVASDSDRA